MFKNNTPPYTTQFLKYEGVIVSLTKYHSDILMNNIVVLTKTFCITENQDNSLAIHISRENEEDSLAGDSTQSLENDSFSLSDTRFDHKLSRALKGVFIDEPNLIRVMVKRKPLLNVYHMAQKKMSNTRFPTIWYVRPAKAQISLRKHAVGSEPMLVD